MSTNARRNFQVGALSEVATNIRRINSGAPSAFVNDGFAFLAGAALSLCPKRQTERTAVRRPESLT